MMMKHDRTISVIIDDLPDFDKNAAEKICVFLEQNGYYIKRITVDEFLNQQNAYVTLGFLLLIPCAASLPAVCAAPLAEYASQGGQVLTLGGPIFYHLIKKVDGRWEKVPLDEQMLDATFTGETNGVVIEGFTPSYKIYPLYGVKRFMTEPDQVIFSSSIKTDQPLNVICPNARPHGAGWNNDRQNRYIPIVQAMGENEITEGEPDVISTGRAEGRRGAAAFFMLSMAKGRCNVTNGTRPGSVSSINVGSAAASIGITNQDLLSIPGAEKLLLSMISRMQQGLYLFEGGSNKFVCKKNENVVLGARILNISQDFKQVVVRFTIKQQDKIIFLQEEKVLTTPRNLSDVTVSWKTKSVENECKIIVELIVDNAVYDNITHDINILGEKTAKPDEFVTVKGDNFYLKGEPWYPVAINYWPHFYPGLEPTDYWSGWLDKSIYDPLEVERDLSYLESMGINCLFTRLDGNVFDRSIQPLKDFLLRCERHGMKLGLSYCNASCPVNYSHEAMKKLIDEAGLAYNPTIFCYDIAWEIGYQFMDKLYIEYWDDEWAKWIAERYGSIENAERDWGMPVSRKADGTITAPDPRLFRKDGAWRIMVAAYRRFMDDYISSLWNKAVNDIRKLDPNHLITYRQGPLSPQDVSFSATNKHIDFVCPEGYHITNDDDGFNIACFSSRYLDHLTGGKPIVWSEYGTSLTGLAWKKNLQWDHDRILPYESKIEEQTSYMELFHKMIKETMVNGSAPWWWPGGFRRVEMSDFGIIGPDGVLRPAGKRYVEYVPVFKRPRSRPEPEVWVTVDRDAHAGGNWHICFNEGKEAYAKAAREGKWLGVRTEGTGTTSVNTPLVAVGNVPYNGSNPPKYLNAEFNSVHIIDAGGKSIEVKKGETIKVKAGKPVYISISVGNIQEAEWIAPKNTDGIGGVYVKSAPGSQLKVKIPIESNVPYLGDAVILSVLLCDGIDSDVFVSLHMEAEGRACFGEVFSFKLSATEW